MYPTPPEWKSWNLRSMWHFGAGWCIPPRNRNLTKHECYRTKSFQERSSSTFYNLPPLSSTIIWFFAWIGKWWISISNGCGYMDLNPICHPSPAKKMKCSFLDYIQLLMIGLAGQWTRTPSTTPLQPKTEMLIFGLCSTSDDRPSWSMDSNPICHPSPAKKWNAHFWIMFTSHDRPGWLMDLNPIHHPSPAKNMKCSFLDYVHFSWSAGLVNGLESHLPPLSIQKTEMFIFGLHSTSDDQPGWLMDSNPIHHPSPTKKLKCSFLDYIQLLMISQAGWWTQTPSTTPLQPKTEMLIFGLHSTSDDRPGWLMDLNPICHLSPAKKKMKCLFLDYVQLLMISWAGQWTQTPSATPLQPKKQEVSITGKRSSDM